MIKHRFLFSCFLACMFMVILSGIVRQSVNAINPPFNNRIAAQDGGNFNGNLGSFDVSQEVTKWITVTSPTPNTLESVDMISANDGWAVGSLGTILHWNGLEWEVIASPTTRVLRAVSMVTATDGWAVGDGGTVLRWDGQQWSISTSPITNKSLREVEMVSSTDGWITGGGGGTSGVIFHWNGSAWTEVSTPTSEALYDVAMISSVDGWTTDRYGRILHWDGDQWSIVTHFPNEWLNTTDMVSTADGWTAGEFGRIKSWDGNEWSAFSSPTGQWLLSIDMLSATEGWMVGSNGTILYWDGTTWSYSSSPTTATLKSVSMVSNSDGWAVGNAGTILRYHAPLDVPLFLQTDPPWFDDLYASYQTQPNNIGKWGCYMTSAAMVINYYAEQSQSAFRTDPGEFNEWLRNNGLYDGNNFLHASSHTYADEKGINLFIPPPGQINGLRNATSDAILDNSLSEGNPAILRVDVPSSPSGHHFVVAVGTTTIDNTPTYVINDPIHGQTTLYEWYSNQYTSIRLFTAQPSERRTLTISAHSPVELLVTDPLGRKTGYDPTTGTSWNDIPNTSYTIDAIAPDGGMGSEAPEEVKTLFVYGSIDGQYTVDVFGTDQGSYVINAFASNLQGEITSQASQGEATNGSLDTIYLNYDSDIGLQYYTLYLPMNTKD